MKWGKKQQNSVFGFLKQGLNCNGILSYFLHPVVEHISSDSSWMIFFCLRLSSCFRKHHFVCCLNASLSLKQRASEGKNTDQVWYFGRNSLVLQELWPLLYQCCSKVPLLRFRGCNVSPVLYVASKKVYWNKMQIKLDMGQTIWI